MPFHRRLFLVADKSAARSAKNAIGASSARGQSREDARLVVQHETTADDDGLPARLLLRKFPSIRKYARVSLGNSRHFLRTLFHATIIDATIVETKNKRCARDCVDFTP